MLAPDPHRDCAVLLPLGLGISSMASFPVVATTHTLRSSRLYGPNSRLLAL